VVLQLDEPSLPVVLAGHVPTESGLSVYRPVPDQDAAGALREVIEAAGVPVVLHSCAADPPIELFRTAGAAAVAVDLSLLTDLDAVGEAVDAGVVLFAGAVPATGQPPAAATVATTVRELWNKLGFGLADLPDRVVVTPACGLAGATADDARAIMVACREAAERLHDEARS
jgi:methionine synthase II (cobalamin-independent)